MHVEFFWTLFNITLRQTPWPFETSLDYTSYSFSSYAFSLNFTGYAVINASKGLLKKITQVTRLDVDNIIFKLRVKISR